MEQKINSADLELKDRLVAINRVTKVTKGGRTFSFSAIVVVGDENGTVGYGLGKANEVTTAISKGVEAAKKNLIKVPVLKGTLPHEREALVLTKCLTVKTERTMAKIKITLVKSRCGSDKRQIATLNALGLGKVSSSVEHETSPQIMGMVAKIKHLVRVEDVK